MIQDALDALTTTPRASDPRHLTLRVYFNDPQGGSVRVPHPAGLASYERLLATRQLAEREHIPFADGYVAEKALLVESMLSPVTFPTTEPLAALEMAFAGMNHDERPNGRCERSLSVGDVACVVAGDRATWYACAAIGWEQIDAPPPEAFA